MNKISKIILAISLVVIVNGLIMPGKASARSISMALFTVFKIPVTTVKESTVAIATSSVSEEVDFERDDKIKRINAYFEKRNMPLAGYGEDFLLAAEKCDMDWRLLPAIGVRESSGGKNEFNNNPFGWGSAKIKFKNFSDAIYNVGEHLCGLRESTERYYKDKTVYQKLWYYNGTVIASYPKEVIEIMDMF